LLPNQVSLCRRECCIARAHPKEALS
jgi:hypothetical protein